MSVLFGGYFGVQRRRSPASRSESVRMSPHIFWLFPAVTRIANELSFAFLVLGPCNVTQSTQVRQTAVGRSLCLPLPLAGFNPRREQVQGNESSSKGLRTDHFEKRAPPTDKQSVQIGSARRSSWLTNRSYATLLCIFLVASFPLCFEEIPVTRRGINVQSQPSNNTDGVRSKIDSITYKISCLYNYQFAAITVCSQVSPGLIQEDLVSNECNERDLPTLPCLVNSCPEHFVVEATGRKPFSK